MSEQVLDNIPGADNFYKSDRVIVKKVFFPNQYKMVICGNLFCAKDLNESEKYRAIVVGHPMGAVKEQSANLYATKMAERGFVALSFDLSFWGESEGEPRNAVLPDVYSEDFSAAVDFLSTQKYVDKDRIGVIGICGSGGFVINATKIDLRIKALATASMVDMGTATRFVYSASREKLLDEVAHQRVVEFIGGKVELTGGTVNKLSDDTPPTQREFYNFYRTPRGEVIPEGATLQTTTHPTFTSNAKFLNFYPMIDIDSISPRPLLFIIGENAMSRSFSEDAYNAAKEPKELMVIPGANHIDLYDRVDLIPFDKLESFFKEYL